MALLRRYKSSFRERFERPLKIGVVLFGLLGDVLMRTSALRELRSSFPDAQIYCYVDPIGAEVLSLSSDQHRVVIVVNRSKESRLLYVWRRLLLHWTIWREGFDILVDFYNGPSSHRLLLTSGAKMQLMVRNAEIICVPPARPVSVRVHRNRHHLSNLYFALLDHISTPVSSDTDVVPWVNHSPLGGAACGFDDRHYFVSLATGDPRKNLPSALLAEIANWLYQECGATPLIACNPGQEHLQDDFAQALDAHNIPSTRLGRMDLSELLNLMRAVRLSILPDTGLFHLAVASGTPVLGIFTHTHPLHVDPFLDRVHIVFKEDRAAGLDQHGLPHGSQKITGQEALGALRVLMREMDSKEWSYDRVHA